jgi:hypothetical protein
LVKRCSVRQYAYQDIRGLSTGWSEANLLFGFGKKRV